MRSHGERYGTDFGTANLQFGDAVFDCPAFTLPAAPVSASELPAESGWLSAQLNGVVDVRWQMQPDDTLILKVTSLVKANWVSIAFGEGMVGSDAIVGWVDSESGVAHVKEYTMTSLDASGVMLIDGNAGGRLDRTYANETNFTDGQLSFTVLVNDPRFLTSGIPVIWAYGDSWQLLPTNANTHSRRAGSYSTIDFRTSGTVVESVKNDTALVPSAFEVPAESGWLSAQLNGVVDVRWQMQPDDTLILKVTSLVKANWVSIAFGEGMVGSDAIVGWVDSESGVAHVKEYTMTSLDASGVMLIDGNAGGRLDRTYANETNFTDGQLSFTVLVNDPRFLTSGIPVIWAYGDSWQLLPTNANTHSRRAGVHSTVDFRSGDVTLASVDGKLVAHGVLMCIAWTFLVPLGIFFARFRADATGFLWIKAHKRATKLASVLMLIAFIIILAWIFDTGRENQFCATDHGKIGMTALVLLGIQIFTAIYRPGKVNAESTTVAKAKRKVWEIGHRVIAVLCLTISVAACFNGLQEIENFGVEDTEPHQTSLGIWIAMTFLIALIRELMKYQPRSKSVDMVSPSPTYDVVDEATTSNQKAPSTSSAARYKQTDLDSPKETRTTSLASSGSRLSIMEGFDAVSPEPNVSAGVHFFDNGDSNRNSVDVDDVDDIGDADFGDVDAAEELEGGYLQVQNDSAASGSGSGSDSDPEPDSEVDLDAESTFGQSRATSPTSPTSPTSSRASVGSEVYDDAVFASSPAQTDTLHANNSSPAAIEPGKSQPTKPATKPNSQGQCSPRSFWGISGLIMSVLLFVLLLSIALAPTSDDSVAADAESRASTSIAASNGNATSMAAASSSGNPKSALTSTSHTSTASGVSSSADISNGAASESTTPSSGVPREGNPGQNFAQNDSTLSSTSGRTSPPACEYGTTYAIEPKPLAFDMLPHPMLLDLDEDGVVTKDELRQGFLRIGQVPTRKQLSDIYSKHAPDLVVPTFPTIAPPPPPQPTTTKPTPTTTDDFGPSTTLVPQTGRDGNLLPTNATVAATGDTTVGIATTNSPTTILHGEATTPSGNTHPTTPKWSYTCPARKDGAGCSAFPTSFVGDGWCDAQCPFNTAECLFDGGDCCNPKSDFMDCRDPSSPYYGRVSAKGVRSPAPRNPRYHIPEVERPPSTRELVTTYNNFYEIAFHKGLAAAAKKVDYFFMDQQWQIQIAGLVDNPMTISIMDLISHMHLEERYYRHRCVEAWSIAVPWLGFPLAKLLDFVGVQKGAKYVKFTSFMNPKVTPNQLKKTGTYKWPYQEAITIDEAMNEMAFLTVGLYQKEITASNGAPIRLCVSFVALTLTNRLPRVSS